MSDIHCFKTLKHQINLNRKIKFISYPKVNTLQLRYEDHLHNAA